MWAPAKFLSAPSASSLFRSVVPRSIIASRTPSITSPSDSFALIKRSIGSCCVTPYFEPSTQGDLAFSVRTVNLKYGDGVLKEVGYDAKELLPTSSATPRAVVFTDKVVKELQCVSQVLASLDKAGVEYTVYDEVQVEPTSSSFMEAAKFLQTLSTKPDVIISVGGGSVMDTAKAALLYATHPPPDGDFLHYVNAPVGKGAPVPRHGLPPHIAIPTTSGTGSECTGFAICAVKEHTIAPKSKTGIASYALCPTMAVIDPTVTHTLPMSVVAASGFDVLSHALESYTARPFTKRPPGPQRHIRPLNQGANPYSDFGCLEALSVCAKYFERALTNPTDYEAREQMMWASTLAGAAMGNAGTHLPHGLSYPVSGQVRSYIPPKGYPQDKPLVPHGMGVSLCAPAAFRMTALACPDRHNTCLQILTGKNASNQPPEVIGELLATELIRLLNLAQFPNGIAGVGYTIDDIPALTKSCFVQKRVIDNAPFAVTESDISRMYRDCQSYW